VSRRLLLCVCAILLAGCRQEGPEARIRKAFAGSVRAVEAGDAAGAAEPLSPKFAGPEGMDRQQARLYLLGVLRGKKIGVTVLSEKLTVEGPRAEQTVDLLLTGRGGGELLPQDSSRRTLVLRWELRDGKWLIREIQTDSY